MVKLAVKILISGILLFLILHRVNLNHLKQMMLKIGVWEFLTLSLLYLLAQAISSLRWSWVIESLGKRVSPLLLFKLYLMGMFSNLFLPSTIGGDTIKGYIVSKSIGVRRAVSSIFLERYNGLLALLLLSLVSSLLFMKLFGLKVVLTIVAINILALLSLYMLRFVKHEKIRNFYADIKAFHKSKRFIPVTALSFVVQIINIVIYILAGERLGLHIELAYYFAFIPLITLISFLPISFNGIGVREFSFVYFFKMANLTPTQSLSLSLTVFFVVVFTSLFGGVFYINNERIIREAKSFRTGT